MFLLNNPSTKILIYQHKLERDQQKLMVMMIMWLHTQNRMEQFFNVLTGIPFFHLFPTACSPRNQKWLSPSVSPSFPQLKNCFLAVLKNRFWVEESVVSWMIRFWWVFLMGWSDLVVLGYASNAPWSWQKTVSHVRPSQQNNCTFGSPESPKVSPILRVLLLLLLYTFQLVMGGKLAIPPVMVIVMVA